eukprot:SAG31_NODE_22541_length_523_cov_0.969340_1_plen_99_part_10
MAPRRCEYHYWLADARHQRWAAHKPVEIRKPAGKELLQSACSAMEAVLECIALHEAELGSGRRYLANLGGGGPTSRREISAGNFVPTLIEWQKEMIHHY